MSRAAVVALVAAMGCQSGYGASEPKVRPVLTTGVVARSLDADAFAGGVVAMVGSFLASREILAAGPVAATEAPSAPAEVVEA